jgi:septum formation protein
LPHPYVTRLAREKALAIAMPGQVTLAADTTVVVGDTMLGKAGSAMEARAMLAQLAAAPHHVITGFAIAVDLDVVHAAVVSTEVDFVATTAEIDAYVASGEWRGKAGAYALQGIGAALVPAIRGSVTNVVGLPLAEVVRALATVGLTTPLQDGVAS